MNKPLMGVLIASAAASLLSACATSGAPAGHGDAMASKSVHCAGVNECKGHGECSGADNSCKGQNSCKGSGWVASAESDCLANGGKVVASK